MRNDPAYSSELTEEAIRERAYQLYEERGGGPGHDLDDWFQAEAEVLAHKPARASLKTSRAKAVAA